MYSRRLYSRRSLHLRRREAYGIVGALPLGTRVVFASLRGRKAAYSFIIRVALHELNGAHHLPPIDI